MADCRRLLESIKRVVRLFKLPPNGYVAVFGSVAEERCTPLSDVDLVVKGLDAVEAGRLAEAVEDATGKRVEVVMVERSSLPLLYEALARSIFIDGDYWAYVEDKWKTTLEWLDYAEAYKKMHKAYRHRILDR